ncbi:MarR family winged helix-turn-helix transcriptional regulator [Curtobacterium sp. MCBD17_021]|uniref:MarR family winged helix-turn-helix transcriptional regulator n=1 Tax=Curtobacterium sp. MCBD17_021 TaxID=2175665 RepID=UPI000DAA9868|nr:MarR family transcriptional regulator [Curtobacterium sp. MCBD17_021]PZE63619.1 MarR family transcriptional regulator [Curtobacterium sp. MCBD17_021]
MPLTVVRREHMHLYAREPRSRAAKNAVEALLRLQHAEEQQLEQARKESGLTKNEFHAVRYMLQAHRDGRVMGPKDLAVMLNVSNASVTKIVDGLVAKGDFVRAQHPTDRRAQVLEPTVQAAEKIDDAYARYHRVVVEIIDHLPKEDNDVLARALEQVTQALNAADQSPAFEDEYVVENEDTIEEAPQLHILT